MNVYLQRTNKPAFVEPASNSSSSACCAISIANSTRLSTRHTDATRHPLAILVTPCRSRPGVFLCLRATRPSGPRIHRNATRQERTMEKLSNRLVSWASLLDEKTVEQARTSSTMPFIYPHLALMPDAHLGLGRHRGSVIPTLGAIMPAAVGVDIGCGMIAVKTQFAASDLPRRPAGGCGSRSSAPSRSRRAATTARSSPPPSRGSRSSRRSPRRRDSTRRRTRATGASSSARSAAATTSSRSRSTRRTGCGCSCTRAAGASATRSRSTTSRSRKRLCDAVVDRPARPRPRLPRRGHAGVHAVHRASSGGRSTSRCSTVRR